jgi:hypothetical protein
MLFSSCFHTTLQTRGPDKRKHQLSLGSRKVAIPFLTLLTNVDDIEQIRTGPADALAAGGAEIRDRNALDRSLLEK